MSGIEGKFYIEMERTAGRRAFLSQTSFDGNQEEVSWVLFVSKLTPPQCHYRVLSVSVYVHVVHVN